MGACTTPIPCARHGPAWNVKGDKAECLVNGTVVASVPKADIVGAGKLESTDGVYGIRVSHNVDLMVTGLTKS